jgi:hypothetical protein
MEIEKDQLLHRYYEAVNDLYPDWIGEDLRVKTARVVSLRSKINQLDPSWKLLDSEIGSMLRILMYLDKMDADTSLAYNHKLSLKICEERRSICPWRLSEEVVRNFNSERKQEPEKKQGLKRDLARITVNVQVALDAEKNDQATDFEEEEEDSTKKAFIFPFVFVKDLK